LERNLGRIFDVMDIPHTDGSHPPAKKKPTEEEAPSKNADILDEEW
jgi:hypothetical protein